MAVLLAASGSFTPGLLNDQEFITDVEGTTGIAGVYVLYVNRSNMAGGDTIVLTTYQKLGAASPKVVNVRNITGAADVTSDDPDDAEVIVLGPLTDANGAELRWWIEQTGGTLRAFPWELHAIVPNE